MAVGPDFTLWSYVASTETEDKPDEDKIYSKDTGASITYLSQTKADEISKEIVDTDFMKKVADAAGDFNKYDEKGDNDGKVALIIEPMDPGTLGFVWKADTSSPDEYFDPLTKLDCLHIQAQCTLGTKNPETEKFEYNENTGVPPYATMAHELTHYIVNGYCEYDDGWINEWFAQSVMMDVIPWDGSGEADQTVSDDVMAIGADIRQWGYFRNYAGPTDPEESLTYPISTLMAGYFTGRMGQDLWKDAITSGNVTEQGLSDFLEKRAGGLGKDLQWWRNSFSITALGQAKGEETWGGEDGEFILNPFDEDDRKKDTIGGTHTAVADYVTNDLQNSILLQEKEGPGEKENYIMTSLYVLSKGLTIEGGGEAFVFEVTKEDIPENETTIDLTISDVGDDVVWAHKDGAGYIEVDRVVYENEPEKPTRDADGNWNYTSTQKKALEQNMRSYSAGTIEGTDMQLDLNLFAKEAAFYTGNKKALIQSLIDKDKSTVLINNKELRIKKVTLKNVKKAYVSQDSIFKETISENNMTAYASYSEKKLPGYVITIDTNGADADIKKAAKKANKMLKKNPIQFELLPINLTGTNVKVEKYNDKKQAVKKMTVTDPDGNTNKLKKKDFSSNAQGDLNEITGEINYNGKVLYDPSTRTVKAV